MSEFLLQKFEPSVSLHVCVSFSQASDTRWQFKLNASCDQADSAEEFVGKHSAVQLQ